MPKHNRGAPGEITIKVKCCAQGCTVTTSGDYKNKRCWHCNQDITYKRYPKEEVRVNGVLFAKGTQWHVVSD